VRLVVDINAMFNLEGERAVVTGGARGLGREIALVFAESGADVAIVDKDKDEAEKVAREIRKLGRNSIVVKTDVRYSHEVEKMVNFVKDRFTKIDILVASAGVSNIVEAEKMSKEEWGRIISINLTGLFLCDQAVGKEMIKQRKGSIINISSMSGFVVNWPQKHVHYNASKAGVIMVTKSLAAEWAEYNVRVNAIAPGYIRTAISQRGLAKYEDIVRRLTPMRRVGEPWEIRGAALFLASKASTYATGAVLVIDGGYSIL